jgi:WD40 repeat protein
MGALAWGVLRESGDGEQAPVVAASPTPTATSQPSATPVVTTGVVPEPPRLAYDDGRSGLWLVGTQSTESVHLADGCDAVQIEWSPDGNLIACSYVSVSVYDLTGRQVWRREDTPPSGSISWSPDSQHLAYRGSDQAIHVVDVLTGEDSAVADDGFPLAWLSEVELLAGLELKETQLGMTYTAYLVNMATGESRLFRDLDRPFWLFPDRQRAVVVNTDGERYMAVYDLTTGQESRVTGGNVAQPSEGIPRGSVAISQDGATFYGADGTNRPTTIYMCDVQSLECTVLGTVPGLLVAISGGGLVAYLTPGGVPEMLSIADLRTGRTVEIALAYHMAWWP